jgi:hypothetical protein
VGQRPPITPWLIRCNERKQRRRLAVPRPHLRGAIRAVLVGRVRLVVDERGYTAPAGTEVERFSPRNPSGTRPTAPPASWPPTSETTPPTRVWALACPVSTRARQVLGLRPMPTETGPCKARILAMHTAAAVVCRGCDASGRSSSGTLLSPASPSCNSSSTPTTPHNGSGRCTGVTSTRAPSASGDGAPAGPTSHRRVARQRHRSATPRRPRPCALPLAHLAAYADRLWAEGGVSAAETPPR